MGTMAPQPPPKPHSYSEHHVKRSTKNGGSKEPSGGNSTGH